MDIKLQLYCFLVSFLYGLGVGISSLWHFRLVEKRRIIDYVLTAMYVYIVVVLYIVIMYRVNRGMFHIYFAFFIGIGVYFGRKVKFLQKDVKKKKSY